jgi:hypothetical protein
MGETKNTSNRPDIQRLDNGQWLWTSPSVFSSTSFPSSQVMNMQKSPVLLTVLVNGFPRVLKVLMMRE